MLLLGRWPCTCIQPISFQIRKGRLNIWIDGELLDNLETEAFLWRDGFRAGWGWTDTGITPTGLVFPRVETGVSASTQAMAFWKNKLEDGEVWFGQLIHWDYNAPIKLPFRLTISSGRKRKGTTHG